MDIKIGTTPVQAQPAASRLAGDSAVDSASAKVASASQAPTKERVESAVLAMQEFAQSAKRDVMFSLEEGSGRVVVKVTDSHSGDVIRQMPSEEALELAERLDEVRSLLFQAKA